MKQLIIFLFAIIYSTISFADSTTVKICYNGEFGFPDYRTIDKELNRFDSSGKLVQNETYLFEYQSWGQVDTTFHLVTRTDYGYNVSGLIDTMLQTQVDFNGTNYYRYNYVYDVSGNLIMKLQFYGTTFPLDSNLRTIKQYDSNNNLISESEEQYGLSQNFSPYTLLTWSYDSLDRNIEYRKINYYSTPDDSLITTYTYSASDKILSKMELGNTTSLDSVYYVYVYDSNDSLIKYTNYRNSIGASWIPYETHDYSYTGNTTFEMISNCPDTSCSDTSLRYTIINDSSGHIIDNLLEYYNFGSWLFRWRETHAYNVLGNIVDYYSRSTGLGCSTEIHTTYDYNTSDDLIHAYTYRYHCNEFYSDCYYYNVDSDSILVLINHIDTTCSNSFVPFAITVEGGVPPYQYDWTPGNYLSDSTVLYPTITNFDTTLTYRLVVTDAMGRTASDTLKLFGYPDLSVPLNIISFGLPCENNSFQLTMDTIPLNYTIYWTAPNIFRIYNDTIVAATSGNYNLFLIDTNGCQYSYQTNVNLFSQPVVSLGADTTICLNDTVVLDAGNFNQYLWNTGDVSQTIEVNSQSPMSDTFFVYVTDTNGCINSDTISVNYVVCLGQDEINTSGINVTAFPKQILIELPSAIPATEFTLIDITGRVVINSVIHDHQLIDISDLPTGVYVYRLENYSGKIVKE